MADLEKVIKGLECCMPNKDDYPRCEECPYADGDTCEDLSGLYADALALLKALWRDVNGVKSCATCANWYKCDPNDDGWKQRFWVDCVGSCKLKWEWQGVEMMEGDST